MSGVGDRPVILRHSASVTTGQGGDAFGNWMARGLSNQTTANRLGNNRCAQETAKVVLAANAQHGNAIERKSERETGDCNTEIKFGIRTDFLLANEKQTNQNCDAGLQPLPAIYLLLEWARLFFPMTGIRSGLPSRSLIPLWGAKAICHWHVCIAGVNALSS